MLTCCGGLKMIAQGRREQQFRGPQLSGLNDSPVGSASSEEPPEPAAAAPPSLRGRGSRAGRRSPEAGGRAADPRQARHAGPAGSRDSRQPEKGGGRRRTRLPGSGR